jgi:hypothetical protein
LCSIIIIFINYYHFRYRFHIRTKACDIRLWSLAYLTPSNDPQSNPLFWKWHNFILLYDWIIPYSDIYVI